jgi:hypothetical protein
MSTWAIAKTFSINHGATEGPTLVTAGPITARYWGVYGNERGMKEFFLYSTQDVWQAVAPPAVGGAALLLDGTSQMAGDIDIDENDIVSGGQVRVEVGALQTALYSHTGVYKFGVSDSAGLLADDTLDMQTNKIVDVVDPTSNQEAATKKYVDDNVGTDAAAIHDDVNAEISAITAKGTPVDGDFLLIEDSAASDAKKRITIGDLPGGGGGGLTVTRLAVDTTLTGSGIYVVDTTSGIIEIELPILSGTPADGYRIKVIRDGANFVNVVPNAADDFWDTTTQRTLFDDFAASSIAADDAATSWYELGRWRTVT